MRVRSANPAPSPTNVILASRLDQTGLALMNVWVRRICRGTLTTLRETQISGATRSKSMHAVIIRSARSRGSAKLLSDTDTLSSWLEAGHSVSGVQDYTNLRLEKSLASFNAAQRLVVSYVHDLPFGKGKRFQGSAHGVEDKLLSRWALNGLTTLQAGLPLAFTTASNLTDSLGGGSRPNVVSPNVGVSGTAQSRINGWFKTQAFQQPAAFTFGSESRTDPVLRAAGIANWDFSVVKRTAITERFNLDLRTEFINLFNRVQSADPNTSLGNPSFGLVTSALNQPRLVQFGLRLGF